MIGSRLPGVRDGGRIRIGRMHFPRNHPMTAGTASPDPTLRPPLCAAAPILSSLLPLAGGVLLARMGMAGWLPVAMLTVWVTCRRTRRSGYPEVLSLLAGYLLMVRAIVDPDPLWAQLPPREVAVEIRIEETFNARKPRHLAGTGRILRAGLPQDTVSGRQAAFYLEYRDDAVPECGPGDVIEAFGVLSFLPATGERDSYTRYLLGRYIYLNLNRGFILGRVVPAGRLEQMRRVLRTASRTVLTSGSDDPQAPGAVLASMMLGERSLLTDERMELYRKTGSFHLFAVSGLHVGSVALCLHLLAGLFRLPQEWRLLPVLAGTWAYVWLTGANPSAMRAGIMISCLGLARILLRQPHLFPALALSAWLVLVTDPAQLFHLGFQLSYAVVGSILLVGLPMASHGHRRVAEAWLFRRHPLPPWKRLLRKLLQVSLSLACVSLSASLASIPLIVQHFSLFTPGGILLGPLLNPLATFCVMAGCLALLLAPVPAFPLGALVAKASWPAIRVMELLLQTCLRTPGTHSQRSWSWPGTGTFLVILMLAAAWWLQRLRQGGHRLHPVSLFLPLMIVAAGLAMSSVSS